MTTSPRIFYLARTVPTRVSGATLAMRRHFLDHHDVDVFVATSEAFEEPDVGGLTISQPTWWRRLARTRFSRFFRNAEILSQSYWLPPRLLEAARRFRLDAVFTVADLTLSDTALLLARRLGVPLIVNFQDWWPRGQFYYRQEIPFSPLIPLLERRFRRLYREADLVFCTSEGMRDFLGSHPNSHVLYPIGDAASVPSPATPASFTVGGKRQLIYTGTAFGSYGRMLLELADALEGHPRWELVIYGKRPDWPSERLVAAEASGLYKGFLPFEQLRSVLAASDACLSVMSFDPDLEVMMRTSFTTKVLDYCSAGRPILMWGPSFCSPIRLLQRSRAALTITSPDPTGVLDCLDQLDREPHLVAALGQATRALAEGELSHNSIHGSFVREIYRLLASTAP
jgi:glycosyltransferase involved in cell wall biosynthesis